MSRTVRPRHILFEDEDEYIRRLAGLSKARHDSATPKRERRRLPALPPLPEPIRRGGRQSIAWVEATAGGILAGLSVGSHASFAGEDDQAKLVAAFWSGFPILGPPSYYAATGELPIPRDWKGVYYCLIAAGIYGTVESLAYTLTLGTSWTSHSWAVRTFHPARFYLRGKFAEAALPGFRYITRTVWLLAALQLSEAVFYHFTGESLYQIHKENVLYPTTWDVAGSWREMTSTTDKWLRSLSDPLGNLE